MAATSRRIARRSTAVALLWHLSAAQWLFQPQLAQCASQALLGGISSQDQVLGSGTLQLRCLARPLDEVLQDAAQLTSTGQQHQGTTCLVPQCDFWWHRRHSPLARRYLHLIRQHQRNPGSSRKLVFSTALHGWPYWGTQNKHINFAYSLAVATGRQLIFDPEDMFGFVPRNASWHRTWHFYMQHQEECALRTQAGQGRAAPAGTKVPWLDFRASQPDVRIPRNQDMFAGPQPVAWYLSNHGLRDLLTNYALMRQLHGDRHYYWRWFPSREMLGSDVPAGFDDMDATLKLSAWRTSLATYAFCPRPWVLEEARCRLRALGLQPNKYIAIHIWRGDKVNNTAGRKYPAEGRLIPARDIFQHAAWVRRASLQPGCCDVAYVVFDVASDLPEIQEAAHEFNFSLVVDHEETRRGSPLFMWPRSKKVHPDTEVLETQLTDFKNTLAFVEAYTLVGADQSTFTRFARTLRGLDGPELVAGLSLAQNNVYREWQPLR